jgi:aspartate/methionine/tyrosine aminotransferase
MEAATLAFTEEGRAAAKQIEADLIERRRLAIALFEPLGFEICAGDGAFYLFVRHQLSGDDLDFTMKLMLEGKVIMIPGQAFGPAGKGFVRISYASHPDKLREAAARTGAWLATQENA